MQVVVGLGNPGRRYAGTRHNVGFGVIETLARRWHLPLGRTHHGLRTARRSERDEYVMLVEPQSLMNLSGEALVGLTHAPPAAQLIVIHDDLDLGVGTVRVKCGGGTAGHRGLESIVRHFGPAFIRVRIGIGRPPRSAAAVDYVLARFNDQDQELINAAIERAADAVECIVHDGAAVAMNRFNQRMRSRAPATAPTIEEESDA